MDMLRRHSAAGLRHRWLALAIAWAVCGAGWAVVELLPSRYEASGRIYADADAILGMLLRGLAVDATPSGQVEILQRTLLSRPNLERVITRTDLDQRVTTPEERAALVQRLTREIRITPQTRNLFTIDYRDHNPRVARDVVQATLTLFIEAATATDRQQMESARAFVAQQITAYEVLLRQAERRRAEFQARYIDVLPSDALGGISRLEAARARLQQVQGELVDARNRVEIIEGQIAAVPAQMAAETTGAGGDGRIAEAERVLRELRLRYTDEHPDVISARSVLAGMRAAGGGAPRSGAAPRTAAGRPGASNPLLEQLRVRLVDANAQIGSLTRQDTAGRAEVLRLDAIARSEPELQAQFLNLDRDYTVLRRNYEELLARRESLQIAGAARSNADRLRLDVVDPPVIPTVPVAPSRPLLFSAVLVVGIGAGLAAAFLLSRLDRSFYTLHDLRALGLPVLGGISAPRRAAPMGAILAYAAGVAILLAGYGAVLAGLPAQAVRWLV